VVQKPRKNYLIRAKWKESKAEMRDIGPETGLNSGQGSAKKEILKNYF